MAELENIIKSPSKLPWLAAVAIVMAASGAVIFSLIPSLVLVALFTAMIGLSLYLGWWAHSMSAGKQPQGTPQSGALPSALVTTAVTTSATAPYDGMPDMGHASTQFARVAIEASPNPVIIINETGHIVTSNKAARKRFAITQDQTRFRNVVRRPDLIDAIEGVQRDQKPRSLSIETRLPVDRYERVSIAAFEASGVRFVLLTALDETESRMSERMRADFLANASHELRTPLAAIIGFIETLRGPARDDTRAREQFLEVMHVQADRMSRLISDLLSLSRIELNEHVPPTQLSDIACAAHEAVDGLTPDKKRRLVINCPDDAAWVLGDRDEMAQVLINLIDNALKYSSFGSKVVVTVTGDVTREEAITLAMRQWNVAARLPLTSPEIERLRLYSVVRVENEGDGIERQYLPRLSERFFRIEDTASGKSGTGLGLAIVKHIVSRHRGGLTVESELGRGSAFSVYLPQPFALPQEIDLGATQAATPAVT
jgi:two-component system, OmpR family, phosphate regulon sensor histidine kinase PhoR